MAWFRKPSVRRLRNQFSSKTDYFRVARYVNQQLTTSATCQHQEEISIRRCQPDLSYECTITFVGMQEVEDGLVLQKHEVL